MGERRKYFTMNRSTKRFLALYFFVKVVLNSTNSYFFGVCVFVNGTTTNLLYIYIYMYIFLFLRVYNFCFIQHGLEFIYEVVSFI